MRPKADFRFFKLKDVFTLANLVLGLWVAILAVEGRIHRGSLVLLANWVIDGLDGLVARLTKTSNLFGAKFDDLADLVAYSVAPGFIAYAVYRPVHLLAAAGMCFFIIAIGAVRLARNQADPIEIPGFWLGFPRPALGLFVVFLLNSRLLLGHRLYLPGALVIVLLGLMGLTRVPYISNKNKFNAFQIAVIVAAPLSSFALYRAGYLWDMALLWMTIYLLTPWIGLKPRTRRDLESRIDAALRRKEELPLPGGPV